MRPLTAGQRESDCMIAPPGRECRTLRLPADMGPPAAPLALIPAASDPPAAQPAQNGRRCLRCSRRGCGRQGLLPRQGPARVCGPPRARRALRARVQGCGERAILGLAGRGDAPRAGGRLGQPGPQGSQIVAAVAHRDGARAQCATVGPSLWNPAPLSSYAAPWPARPPAAAAARGLGMLEMEAQRGLEPWLRPPPPPAGGALPAAPRLRGRCWQTSLLVAVAMHHLTHGCPPHPTLLPAGPAGGQPGARLHRHRGV